MSLNDQKAGQAAGQEQCWFCHRAIYKVAESNQGGCVSVDEELQQAYLSCQHPADTKPFIHFTTTTNEGATNASPDPGAVSGPKREHQSCRDQARLWVETGSANPREAAENLDLKDFWELPPHQQALYAAVLKRQGSSWSKSGFGSFRCSK